MLFWIIVTALAVLSVAILAVPALRRPEGDASAAAYDLRVYRDQLKEVDRDLARGVIEEADAERTRTEISRRILAADAQAEAGMGAGGAGTGALAMIGAAAVVLIGGGLWLYLQLGVPGYSDLPRELREANAAALRETRPSQAQAEAETPPAPPLENVAEDYKSLVIQLRATVAERPDDLQGHILLARNEAILGNFTAAYAAQGEVLRIKGDDATSRDYLNYADLLILAAGGYISPEAETALEAALKRDPGNGAAQYYWGQMYAQTGRPDLAFRIWQRLLNASAPEAPWVPLIRAQIEDVAALAGETRFTLPPLPAQLPTPIPGQAPSGAPGPSAEDIEAAQDMSAEDRAAMIEGMVEQLAERLATEGGPAPEWARLIRALAVTGQQARAQAIYDEAKNVFTADPGSLPMLEAAAREAGLTP